MNTFEDEELCKKLEELMKNELTADNPFSLPITPKAISRKTNTTTLKDISKITLTLSANILPIYSDGTMTVSLQTKRGTRLREGCVTCYVYTDDLFPMCNSANTKDYRRFGANRYDIEIPCSRIWLPGNYLLFVREFADNTLTRIPFHVNELLEVTLDAPTDCLPCSLGDILTSCIENVEVSWDVIAQTPGTAELRQYAIHHRQLSIYNEFRKALNGGELTAERNLLIYTTNKDWTQEMMGMFQKLTISGTYFTYIDSSTLYNAALTNPYEELNEKFNVTSKQVFCLTNVGALLNTGGKVIVKRIIEKIRDESVQSTLWFCGSRQEIDSVLQVYPSLRSLFHRNAHVAQHPYTGFEIVQTVFKALQDEHLEPSDEVKDTLSRTLLRLHQQGCLTTWTLDDIRRYVAENVRPNYMRRAIDDILSQDEVLPLLELQDIDLQQLPHGASDFENSIAELNAMVGLDDIKRSIITMANQTRFFMQRRRAGFKTTCSTPHHAIFTGNPGTGKTTVAKMLGKIYHAIGLLSRGEVICVDRTRLVGRYIGETEENMKIVLEEARGNVLFIDEAYNLSEGTNDRKDYGNKVIDSLLTVLSQNDPDMVIVFAGYEKEMDAMLNTNPGLMGRFPYKYRFADYTADQLLEIALQLFRRDEYILTDEARDALRDAIAETLAVGTKNFGNARWVEQFVSNGIIPAMADRVTHSGTNDFQHVLQADVEEGFRHFNPRVVELRPRRQVGFSA